MGGMGMPNKIIGMAHGVLFLSYIVIAIIVSQLIKWNFKTLLIVIAMSIVPFGTFWMEREYLEKELKV